MRRVRPATLAEMRHLATLWFKWVKNIHGRMAVPTNFLFLVQLVVDPKLNFCTRIPPSGAQFLGKGSLKGTDFRNPSQLKS
jgi:hypothetical protein